MVYTLGRKAPGTRQVTESSLDEAIWPTGFLKNWQLQQAMGERACAHTQTDTHRDSDRETERERKKRKETKRKRL